MLCLCAVAALALLVARCCAGPPQQKRYCQGERRRRHLDRLRAQRGNFPKPFPNGWYHICDAHELEGGRVVSVTALGREMVAFRGADGRAGFCTRFVHIWARTLGTEGEWKATT